jgi:hypothetical protein
LGGSVTSPLALAVDGPSTGAATGLWEPRRHTIANVEPAKNANAMTSAGQCETA